MDILVKAIKSIREIALTNNDLTRYGDGFEKAIELCLFSLKELNKQAQTEQLNIDKMIEQWEEKHSSQLDEYSKGNANNEVMQMYRSQMKNVLDFINQLKQVKNCFIPDVSVAKRKLCPTCGNDSLITLSDITYCMNDCCDGVKGHN